MVNRLSAARPVRLPPILPVVLYQGARPWNSPLAFEALVDPVPAGGDDPGESREHQDLAAHTPLHIPWFEPLFVNLQSLPDEDLSGGVRAVVALLFLKYLVRRVDREEGRVAGKQDVLIRQLSRKFEVSDAEREKIRGVEDPDRLDAALDELVVAETKEAVLRVGSIGPTTRRISSGGVLSPWSQGCRD
ncbi:MAG: Rpn family recombination-promoting nuclease/putative transposase [Spirochaetaceae bacterium]